VESATISFVAIVKERYLNTERHFVRLVDDCAVKRWAQGWTSHWDVKNFGLAGGARDGVVESHISQSMRGAGHPP
jgi:hypothetical protein